MLFYIFYQFWFFSFQAARFAENATERFFNDLRRDIGDNNFDRLFSINPLQAEAQAALNALNNGQRFRFFTPALSASVKKSDKLFMDLKNWITKRVKMFKSLFSSKKDLPTYDLSDLDLDVKDQDNFRVAPYIIGGVSIGRKKRFIDALRKHR